MVLVERETKQISMNNWKKIKQMEIGKMFLKKSNLNKILDECVFESIYFGNFGVRFSSHFSFPPLSRCTVPLAGHHHRRDGFPSDVASDVPFHRDGHLGPGGHWRQAPSRLPDEKNQPTEYDDDQTWIELGAKNVPCLFEVENFRESMS